MKRRFLFLLMAVCSFVGANAALNRTNNHLYAKDVTAKQGQTVEVTLNMKNLTKKIINWKTTLNLPEGVTFVSAVAADRWTEEIAVTDLTLFSETENAVEVGDGCVAKITLQVASTVAEGEYEIQLTDMVMTADDQTSIAQTDSQTFKLTVEAGEVGVKGDVDGNGSVGVGDIEAVLNIMAGGDSTPAADVDGNGSVGVGDIEAILNIMAGGE